MSTQLVTGVGHLPLDEGFKTQVAALFRAGCTIEQIATSLGKPEVEVKQAIIGDAEACGVNGEISFSPGELTLVKARLFQIAMNGENDNVKLKALTWIADQHTVSKETRFRAEKGLSDNRQNHVTNIMIALQQANEKAMKHAKDGSNA